MILLQNNSYFRSKWQIHDLFSRSLLKLHRTRSVHISIIDIDKIVYKYLGLKNTSDIVKARHVLLYDDILPLLGKKYDIQITGRYQEYVSLSQKDQK